MIYRPDIDGLRAIAVLAVVGFHFFPDAIPGGFIGVDIFFVISGFLITSILLENLAQNRFRLLDFYGRRIRRIFPPLAVVMIVSLVFGWIFLLPAEYKSLGKHAVGGTSFLSNFFYWREAGYFDSSAISKPLLHFWSLAIEEQFYIIWPLFLLLGWRVKSYLLLICMGMVLGSFSLNLWEVYGKHDLVAAFYSPLTRFWELLIGASLAMLSIKVNHIEKNLFTKRYNLFNKYSNVISILGMVLILTGLMVIQKGDNFPGAWALLPTVATYLLIGAGPESLVSRVLLSRKLLVNLGLISYSLYLWHWPILSFIQIINGEIPSVIVRIIGILTALFLAAVTYFLIERPLRFGGYYKIKTIFLVLVMILIGGFSAEIVRQDGRLNQSINIRAAEFSSYDYFSRDDKGNEKLDA